MSDYDIARRLVKVFADRHEIRSGHLRAGMEDLVMAAIGEARTEWEREQVRPKQPEGKPASFKSDVESLLRAAVNNDTAGLTRTDYSENGDEVSWSGEDIEPQTFRLSDNTMSQVSEFMESQYGMGQS